MLERKRDYKAWFYIAIPLILLGVFTFYPLVKTVLISFFSEYDSTTDSFGRFFDFEAYISIFRTPYFMESLGNTLILVFVSVPISTILAIIIAVALNSIKPLQKIFQTIFFLPYVTNTIAIGMVFSVLFSQPVVPGLASPGLINTIFGINTNWLNGSESKWMAVVLIYNIWNALPFKILVFIGGLQSISKQYYDAAKIDSTPGRRVFSRITVPLLSPMISYIVITSFIGTFKSYESVLAVAGTNGVLSAERWTVVAYVYDAIAGIDMNPDGISYYSKGAAAAVVLFVIILIFTMINMQISKKRVHY